MSLLDRGVDGVKLTSDGIQLFPYIKRIVKESKILQTKIEEINNIQTDFLRIGTLNSLTLNWLPKIINKFKADYPNVEYELLLGGPNEIENWILEGRVDCGFLSIPTHNKLDTIFLEKDQWKVVLPADHRFKDEEKVSIEDLSREPFILLEKDVKSEARKIFESYNLKPNIQYTTGNTLLIMRMVEKGLGVSLLPSLAVRGTSHNIRIKDLTVPAYHDVGFALKNEETAPLLVKRFMNYLSTEDS